VRQGDVVMVADKSGLVEEMTLRYIRLRDFEGSVHYVPNGTIGTVTNRSRGYAYAVIDIGVAYREDIDEVYALMRMRTDRQFILQPSPGSRSVDAGKNPPRFTLPCPDLRGDIT
jgi:small-conductance mechanosensitive channel